MKCQAVVGTHLGSPTTTLSVLISNPLKSTLTVVSSTPSRFLLLASLSESESESSSRLASVMDATGRPVILTVAEALPPYASYSLQKQRRASYVSMIFSSGSETGKRDVRSAPDDDVLLVLLARGIGREPVVLASLDRLGDHVARALDGDGRVVDGRRDRVGREGVNRRLVSD